MREEQGKTLGPGADAPSTRKVSMRQRHYYVSTGYNIEQAIAGLLPVKEGTLVIYTNRTSTDQLAGFGSAAKRTIGRKIMAGELEKLFEKTRAAVVQ